VQNVGCGGGIGNSRIETTSNKLRILAAKEKFNPTNKLTLRAQKIAICK